MIIYIHGFGSSGEGMKSRLLKAYFQKRHIPFISPSLSYIPALAIQTLEELIGSYSQKVTLIGSSLGGYYTLYLSEKYGLKSVLINPSIQPYITLAPYTGDAKSFYDNSSFKWQDSHIEMLKNYQITVSNQAYFMLLLQKGDETLDYQKALDFLPYAKHCVEDGGDHSFQGIERYFERIENFFEA